METITRCLKAIGAFNEELRNRGEWVLSQEDIRVFCEQVLPYLAEDMEDDEIAAVVHHYFYHGPMVEAMLNLQHPDYEIYWSDFYFWLQGFVRKLGVHPAEMDDFLQDLFFHFREKLDRYHFRTPLRSWAFRVSRNFLLDKYRRDDRAPTFVSIEVLTIRPDEKATADQWLTYEERARILDALLRELLSDRYFLILQLTAQKGKGRNKMTDAEIAEIVGLKPGSIPKIRERIRKRLGENAQFRAFVQEFFGADYLSSEKKCQKKAP